MIKRTESLLIHCSQWGLSILFVMFVYVLYSTFGPIGFPIDTIVSDYEASRTSDGTIVIHYKCSSVIHDNVELHVHREVKHLDSGLLVVLPTTEVVFNKGSNSVYRQFYIPPPAPSGKWCVTAKSEWRPTWSLRDRAVNPTTKCFTVK